MCVRVSAFSVKTGTQDRHGFRQDVLTLRPHEESTAFARFFHSLFLFWPPKPKTAEGPVWAVARGFGQELDLGQLDYLIVSHTEPDHSGLISKVFWLSQNQETGGLSGLSCFLSRRVKQDSSPF